MKLIKQKKDVSTITTELNWIEKALRDKREYNQTIRECDKKIRDFWDLKGKKPGTVEKGKKDPQKQGPGKGKKESKLLRSSQSDTDLSINGKAMAQTQETGNSDAVDNITSFFEQLVWALHDLLKNNIQDESKVKLPSVPAISDKELENKFKSMHAKVEETTKVCIDKNRELNQASEFINQLFKKATHVDEGHVTGQVKNKGSKPSNLSEDTKKNRVQGHSPVPSKQESDEVSNLDVKVARILSTWMKMEETKELMPAVKEEKNQQQPYSAERKRLEEEVESLRMRLSALAGAKLCKDNPDIADLSDPNRPTKLRDNYCEIYSNEWMDAYQKLSESKPKRSEVNVIKVLLDILLEGFKYCTTIKARQRDGLQDLILYPDRDYEKRQVKKENKEMDDIFVRHMSEVLKLSGDMTGEHVAMEFFRKKDMIDKFGSDFEKSEKYIKQCVKLCWLMQVQTPPVCIDLSAKPGDKFDNETYKVYTKKGKTIDFIVWPPLRRNEGGHLIEKGVAQGK